MMFSFTTYYRAQLLLGAEGGERGVQQRPQPMVAAALVQAALDAVQRVTAAGVTEHGDAASPSAEHFASVADIRQLSRRSFRSRSPFSVSACCLPPLPQQAGKMKLAQEDDRKRELECQASIWLFLAVMLCQRRYMSKRVECTASNSGVKPAETRSHALPYVLNWLLSGVASFCRLCGAAPARFTRPAR